jgi:hypothetical protein
VLVVLDLLEFQQVQPDLVVDEAEVGRILRVQRIDRRLLLEALAP